MSLLSSVDLFALQQTVFERACEDEGIDVLVREVDIAYNCVVVYLRYLGVACSICSCAVNISSRVGGFGTAASGTWRCRSRNNGARINCKERSCRSSKSVSHSEAMEVLMLMNMGLAGVAAGVEKQDYHQH
jgi:hypothetical protein